MTAKTYTLFVRTWKKLVEPSVTIGERTSLFDTTWIRKTPATDRLEERYEMDKYELPTLHTLGLVEKAEK